MTFDEYEAIKGTMEHVIVVLNVAEKYKESDEVSHSLFLMLREYKDVDADTYRKRFRKYFDLAGEVDSQHMEGYLL